MTAGALPKEAPRARPAAGASQSACAAAPAAGRPGLGGAQGRPQLSFDQIRQHDDADGDGRVTRAEFKGPQPFFQRLDRNGDGVLTAEDFKDAP